MHTFQAVLLVGAGSSSSTLYPLTAAGTPASLLPVANEPLLSFTLKALESSGIDDLVVVCAGRSVGSKVSSWLEQKYPGARKLRVETVQEDKGTAEALRKILDLSNADSIVLASGDVVTDFNLQGLLTTHTLRNATVTALFTPRSSPAAVTKPGKAPKAVDFVGLDSQQNRLLFLDSSREDKREVRVPLHVLKTVQHINLGTHLRDQHLYVLDRKAAQLALQVKPHFTSIQKELIPYMVRHQQCPPVPLAPLNSSEGLDATSSSGAGQAGSTASSSDPLSPPVTLGTVDAFSHSAPSAKRKGWLCQAFLPPPDSLCVRADTLETYGDANREVATPDRAPHLLGKVPDERTGALLADGVALGHKAAVGPGCVVGPHTRVGDRTSVKRSVLGPNCVLGANVKVDKSVLMDGVIVGDAVQLHSCIVCPGAHIADGCSLRDCQVGADFKVVEGTDSRGEILARQTKLLSHLPSIG